MLNDLALFIVSVVVIVFFDDDPRAVSLTEWVMFAIMIYAVFRLIRRYRDLFDAERKRRH